MIFSVLTIPTLFWKYFQSLECMLLISESLRDYYSIKKRCFSMSCDKACQTDLQLGTADLASCRDYHDTYTESGSDAGLSALTWSRPVSPVSQHSHHSSVLSSSSLHMSDSVSVWYARGDEAQRRYLEEYFQFSPTYSDGCIGDSETTSDLPDPEIVSSRSPTDLVRSESVDSLASRFTVSSNEEPDSF